MKTLIITPACNEGKYLSELIQSMASQSSFPEEWIVIDDGSIDNTTDLIQNACLEYPWIRYIRKEKEDVRSPGRSVMDVFYYGFEQRLANDYDIVMKLDADLILPNNYLSEIKKHFLNNEKIGICGGVCVIKNKTGTVIEPGTNLDHLRGPIKAYRRNCFEEIGGLVKKMGWDTIDEHHARFLGWQVCVIRDLEVLHRRRTNTEYGLVKAAYVNGKMIYSIRMDFLLLLTNCFKRMIIWPYCILGLVMLIGYLVAFFTRHEKIVSKELGQFIRRYRYQKISERFFKK